MNKPYSKAAKRRARKAFPELAEIPRREKSGCYVERTRQQPVDPDPQRTVLEARARQMGQPKDKAQDMQRERLSEQAGQAIDILCDPEAAARLWDHWKGLTGAEDRYHRSIGGSMHAKTAKVEMTPEPFEARADDTIDLRTEGERDIDAERAWDAWLARIAKLPLHSRAALQTARRDWATLAEGGQVTPAGRRFVDAMERLDVVM